MRFPVFLKAPHALINAVAIGQHARCEGRVP